VESSETFVYRGERTMEFITNSVPRAAILSPETVECDRPGGGPVLLDGRASSDSDSTPGTNDDISGFEWFEDFGLPAQRSLGAGETLATSLTMGTHTITLRVTDRPGESNTSSIAVTVVDTRPPDLACPAAPAVECQGGGGAEVSLVARATDRCGGVTISNDCTPNGADASGRYPLGTAWVGFTATDAAGNRAVCSSAVTVRDTRPPILLVNAVPATLWPPNHEMARVSVNWQVTDDCDPAVRVEIVDVTSSEADDAPGMDDGATTQDVQDAAYGTTDLEVWLRAERDGRGFGRTYTLDYRAVDAAGNASPAVAVVTVPHDLGRGPEPLIVMLAPTTANGAKAYWSSLEGATSYDVIRGDLAGLRFTGGVLSLGTVEVLACTEPSQTWMEEGSGANNPAAGRGYFYLVEAWTEAGPTGYSTESGPWPRIPDKIAGDCLTPVNLAD
jgi:HYR domain-containing protein